MNFIKNYYSFCLLSSVAIAGNLNHLVLSYDRSLFCAIVQPGNKFYVTSQSSFQFDCQTPDERGGHRSKVGWTKFQPDLTLDPIEKSQNGQLVMSSVDGKDSGKYDCAVSDKNSHSYANVSVQLFVYDALSSIKSLGPYNFNDSVQLKCDFDADAWTFNSENIQNNKYLKLNSSSWHLSIDSPVAERTGIYSCSKQKRQQMFSVEGRPQITGKKQMKKNLMEGENAILKCQLNSYPMAEIVWTIISEKSVKVSSNERVNLLPLDGYNNSILFISKLEFSDEGIYECKAQNQHGSDSLRIELRVKDKWAALWPFLGIVAEVLILVSIVFIYEKKTALNEDQKSVTEEDENNEQKKALTGDSESQDVRRRDMRN